VVWLPDEQVLFGTCMVREQAGTSVGNLADASLETWEAALAAVRARVPAPRVVVPGHGEPGDAGLLDHTLALVRAARGGR
jgi:metallo-beta-lactamase class B